MLLVISRAMYKFSETPGLTYGPFYQYDKNKLLHRFGESLVSLMIFLAAQLILSFA